jgi:hypothetical protein
MEVHAAVSTAKERGSGVAGAVARVGGATTAIRMPPAARSSQARRVEGQPQADGADLSGGRPFPTVEAASEARGLVAGADAFTYAAESVLVDGLCVGSLRTGASVPGTDNRG